MVTCRKQYSKALRVKDLMKQRSFLAIYIVVSYCTEYSRNETKESPCDVVNEQKTVLVTRLELLIKDLMKKQRSLLWI